MPANFGFVFNAAKAHSYELSSERPRDRSRNRGFTNARRTYEAEYRAARFVRERQHRKVFHYAFFYLIKSEMVFIEYLASDVQIVGIAGFFFKRQI